MAYSGYYEYTVFLIDNDEMKISDLDNETLFMNIYNYYCFKHFMSMYYIWQHTALDRLRNNIKKKKWKKDFTNVNLFIELLERRYEPVNPSNFFFKSEDYFLKLILLKHDLDKLIKVHHKKQKIIKKKKKKRKPIR